MDRRAGERVGGNTNCAAETKKNADESKGDGSKMERCWASLGVFLRKYSRPLGGEVIWGNSKRKFITDKIIPGGKSKGDPSRNIRQWRQR